MRLTLRMIPLTLAFGCGGNDRPDPDAPPTSEPAAIKLTLRDPGGATTSNAAFVAVRDGDGAWTPVTGEGGVYNARVTSNRYGWWVGCVRASGTGRNSIAYRHLDDGTDFERNSCVAATLPLTISGAVTGVPEDESTEAYSLWDFDFPSAGTYSLGAEAAPAQVLASRIDANFNAVSVLRADLGAITTNTTHDFDFAAAPAFVRLPVNVVGRQTGDLIDTITGVYSGDGDMYLPFEGAKPDGEFLALPAALVQPGDTFDATITATLEIDATRSDRRGAGTFAATIPATLTLPANKSFGNAAVTENPFSIGWTLPAHASDGTVSALWISDSRDNRLLITSIATTERWAAASTTIDIEEPAGTPTALSNLPGNSISWLIDELSGDLQSAWTSAGSSGSTPGAQAARRTARSVQQAMHATRLELVRARRAR